MFSGPGSLAPGEDLPVREEEAARPPLVYDPAMTGRAIIVHCLDHARVALAAAQELGVPVTLASAPGASAYLGPAWLPQVAALAGREFPDAGYSVLLDCGERAGDVMAALREGVACVAFSGPEPVARKLGSMAQGCGARLVSESPESLDLLDRDDTLEACRAWLKGAPS